MGNVVTEWRLRYRFRARTVTGRLIPVLILALWAAAARFAVAEDAQEERIGSYNELISANVNYNNYEEAAKTLKQAMKAAEGRQQNVPTEAQVDYLERVAREHCITWNLRTRSRP